MKNTTNKINNLFNNKHNFSKPYIIAEAGVNHEGSIDLAKRLIYEAKEGGANAIKFQTYKASTLACKNSPSYWDLSKEKTKSQSSLVDIDKLLVRFTILDGDLKKVIEKSTDPKGPDGEKITKVEKKKIFDSIKAIEDKILKIKLTIDKK